MKKYIDFIKEMFKTKRRRAVLELGAWILFFIIIFSMVGGADKEYYKSYNSKAKLQEEKLGPDLVENIKKVNSYEFEYLIEAKDSSGTYTYNVSGTYFKDKYFATILNKDYYLTDEDFYIVDSNLKTLTKPVSKNKNALYNLIDIRLLTNNNLYTLINSSEQIDSKTYKDETKITRYKYINYNDKYIVFTIKSKDNLFSEIEADFTNYYERKYNSFKVNINYKNVNNILDFNKSYDNYKIVEE